MNGCVLQSQRAFCAHRGERPSWCQRVAVGRSASPCCGLLFLGSSRVGGRAGAAGWAGLAPPWAAESWARVLASRASRPLLGRCRCRSRAWGPRGRAQGARKASACPAMISCLPLPVVWSSGRESRALVLPADRTPGSRLPGLPAESREMNPPAASRFADSLITT